MWRWRLVPGRDQGGGRQRQRKCKEGGREGRPHTSVEHNQWKNRWGLDRMGFFMSQKWVILWVFLMYRNVWNLCQCVKHIGCEEILFCSRTITNQPFQTHPRMWYNSESSGRMFISLLDGTRSSRTDQCGSRDRGKTNLVQKRGYLRSPIQWLSIVDVSLHAQDCFFLVSEKRLWFIARKFFAPVPYEAGVGGKANSCLSTQKESPPPSFWTPPNEAITLWRRAWACIYQCFRVDAIYLIHFRDARCRRDLVDTVEDSHDYYLLGCF